MVFKSLLPQAAHERIALPVGATHASPLPVSVAEINSQSSSEGVAPGVLVSSLDESRPLGATPIEDASPLWIAAQ